MTNRIREVRKAKKLTLQALADLSGISTSYLSRLEGGGREVDLKHIRTIADALNVKAADLVDAPEPETHVIPIMGYVGAGAEVMPDFEQVPPDGLDQVELNFPVPEGVIGLQVKGDSMLPRFRDSDVLLVYAEQRLGFRDYLGEEVVVRTRDGRRFVKTLLRGPDPGTFNLDSHNARMIEAVQVVWVGEIYLIVPSKQIRQLDRAQKAAATRRKRKLEDETAGMDELPLAKAKASGQ